MTGKSNVALEDVARLRKEGRAVNQIAKVLHVNTTRIRHMIAQCVEVGLLTGKERKRRFVPKRGSGLLRTLRDDDDLVR